MEIGASIDTNVKIQRSMKNMKITQEEMVKVAERFKAINAFYETGHTLTENLVSYYRTVRPELTQEEATDVVSNLMQGCEDLTLKYNQAISDGFDAESEVKILTKDMDVETRFNYLVNALSVVDALNSSAFATRVDAEETVRQYIEEYSSATPYPTESDCDAIEKLLVESIANNTLLLTGLESAQELLASAKDTDTVIDFASSQYDDARTKAEMALAMWIEYEEGTLSTIDSGATPESIGIGAATAVEESKIMDGVARGRTTSDFAIKCLKVLGGVALFLLLGYFGLVVSAVVGGLAATSLLSVFGTSAIACIATIALCFPLLWGMAELIGSTCVVIIEKTSKVFDYVVEKLRETVIPKLQEIAIRFMSWVRDKLGVHKTSKLPLTETATVRH